MQTNYSLLEKIRTVDLNRLPAAERQRFIELYEMLPRPEMRLVEFVRSAWHVVEPFTPYQHNWHIDVICSHLEAATYQDIRNLVINIQPRHMKSLLVAVFWPVWVWSFMPYSQWLFISHKQELSIRDNLKRRRIIKSDWYQDNYGHVFQLTRDQSKKTWFENDQRGHMIASGLTGAIGLGADFIVGDDILSREHAFSAARRDFANTVWDETVSTRGNNPKSVVKVMIAQRLHENDPIGHIFEMETQGAETYDKLIIPTEYEPDAPHPPTKLGWIDPRTKPGELLWPGRFDAEAIKRLKVSLGSMGASAQLQQRPSPAGGNIFHVDWWKFWIPEGMELPPVRLKTKSGKVHVITPEVLHTRLIKRQIQSWDAAFKDAENSSYVVGQVWGVIDANFYLMNQERDRMNMPATLEAIRRVTEQYPGTRAKIVEDKANGPAVIQTLQNEIPGMIAVNPSGSKEARANAVAPYVESGNVYLPHPAIAPWVQDLIDECTNFPSSVYNDQVDALTQALTYLTGKGGKRARSRTRG